MGQLENIFNYQGSQIRTFVKDGETQFAVVDVCNVLEISNSRDALSRIDEDEKGVVSTDTLGGSQQINVVTEPGLYSLILGSRKPEAKEFKRWITHEVLPSIRKTGSYSTSQAIDVSRLTPEMQLFNQMFNAMAKMQLDYSETRKQLVDVTTTVATMQETFLQHDEDWRKSINSMLSGVVYRLKGEHQALRNESYDLLEERAHCDLSARLRNLRSRLEAEGATKTKIEATRKLDVIETDVRLKEIYSTIVKELSIGSLKIVR